MSLYRSHWGARGFNKQLFNLTLPPPPGTANTDPLPHPEITGATNVVTTGSLADEDRIDVLQAHVYFLTERIRAYRARIAVAHAAMSPPRTFPVANATPSAPPLNRFAAAEAEIVAAMHTFESLFHGWGATVLTVVLPPWTADELLRVLRPLQRISDTLRYASRLMQLAAPESDADMSAFIRRVKNAAVNNGYVSDWTLLDEAYRTFSRGNFTASQLWQTSACFHGDARALPNALDLGTVEPEPIPNRAAGEQFRIMTIPGNIFMHVNLTTVVMTRLYNGLLKFPWKNPHVAEQRAVNIFLWKKQFNMLTFRDLYPEAFVLAHRPEGVRVIDVLPHLYYAFFPLAVPPKASTRRVKKDHEMHLMYEWWSKNRNSGDGESTGPIPGVIQPKMPDDIYDAPDWETRWRRSWYQLWPEMPLLDKSLPRREDQKVHQRNPKILHRSPANILVLDPRSGAMYTTSSGATTTPNANKFLSLALNSWNIIEFYRGLNRLFATDSAFAATFVRTDMNVVSIAYSSLLGELARRTWEELPFLWNAVVRAHGPNAHRRSPFLPLDFLPSQEYLQQPFVHCRAALNFLRFLIVGRGIAGIPYDLASHDFDITHMEAVLTPDAVRSDPFQLAEWRETMAYDAPLHPDFYAVIAIFEEHWEAAIGGLVAYKQINTTLPLGSLEARDRFYRNEAGNIDAFFVFPRVAHRLNMLLPPSNSAAVDTLAFTKSALYPTATTMFPVVPIVALLWQPHYPWGVDRRDMAPTKVLEAAALSLCMGLPPDVTAEISGPGGLEPRLQELAERRASIMTKINATIARGLLPGIDPEEQQLENVDSEINKIVAHLQFARTAFAILDDDTKLRIQRLVGTVAAAATSVQAELNKDNFMRAATKGIRTRPPPDNAVPSRRVRRKRNTSDGDDDDGDNQDGRPSERDAPERDASERDDFDPKDFIDIRGGAVGAHHVVDRLRTLSEDEQTRIIQTHLTKVRVTPAGKAILDEYLDERRASTGARLTDLEDSLARLTLV